jgi:putative ABC transport system permease protein
MSTVLSLCKGLLFKQKKVSILIAVIFLICFVCISSGISTLRATGNLFEKVIDDQNFSHELAHFSINDYPNWQEIESWFKNHDMVESAQLSYASNIIEFAKFKDEDISLFYQEIVPETEHDFIRILQGEESEYPAPLTLWISVGLSKRYSITVGDDILIPNGSNFQSYKVSAVILDPLFSSTMISPFRVWVRPGELALMKPFSSLDKVILTIRFKDPSQNSIVWNDFSMWQGASFKGFIISYDDFKMGSSMATLILVIALLITGLLLLIICLIVLFFIIFAEISNQFKTFGVLKAHGISFRQITLAIILQYLFLLIIGIPFVIPLSHIASMQIVSQYIQALGLAVNQLPTVSSVFIAFLAISTLIILAIYSSASRIRKINPAQAIREGQAPKKVNRKVFLKIKDKFSTPVSLFLQLKENANSKGKFVFSIIIIFALAFVMFFSIGFLSSFNKFFSTTGPMGYPETDLIVMSENNLFFGYDSDDVYSYLLQQDNYIAIWPGYKPKESLAIKLTGKDDYNVTTYCILGDYDENNISVIDGKNPKTANEIALTQIASEQTGKGIGDIVTLSMNGKEIPFTVCGIYHGINDIGKNVRVQFSALQLFNPNSKANWFFIDYKDTVIIADVKKEIEAKMGGYVTIQNPKQFLASLSEPILSAAAVIIMILVCITALVCVITLYNFTILSFYREKKNYGIYLTAGFSTKQIVNMQIVRIVIISAIGICLAFFIALNTMEPLLSNMFKALGISSVELVFNPLQLVLAVLITLSTALLSVFSASRLIKNLNLRELVIE